MLKLCRLRAGFTMLLLLVTFCFNALANGNKPLKRTWFARSAGNNSQNPPQFRLGYNYGVYSNHLSGAEIYTYQLNNGIRQKSMVATQRIINVSDPFTRINDFHGFYIGLETGYGSDNSHPFRLEINWNNRHKTSDIKYTYDTGPNTEVTEHYEKVKIRYNTLGMGLGYRPKLGNLLFGAGIDLGIFSTTMKVDDAKIAEKGWQPWFWSVKVLGDGRTGKTPVVGYQLFASYDLSAFTLRLQQQFGMLNADLNSQTGKYTDLPWSTKNFPIANTTFTLSYNFKKLK